ncbi:hypothetical protein K0M31_016379 [Melipona bicolor]|uniref:Uncharacterized protein n=1 Tax=Melipona bicolor TaxID=60889 RepID=A0AA40G707_9HYME|nr:hypothetical protein K0M31_016379 [Melipona bicolor]
MQKEKKKTYLPHPHRQPLTPFESKSPTNKFPRCKNKEEKKKPSNLSITSSRGVFQIDFTRCAACFQLSSSTAINRGTPSNLRTPSSTATAKTHTYPLSTFDTFSEEKFPGGK